MYVSELNDELKWIKAALKSSIFRDRENFFCVGFVYDKVLWYMKK